MSAKENSLPLPIVGLTGGIGSGKSTAGEYFKLLGINVVDVDQIAREVVEPGHPALEHIITRFGNKVLLDNGHLDRAKLRQIIFSDPKQRIWLEKLTHPLIMTKTMAALQHDSKQPYALLVSPLLFESNQHKLTRYNIVIDLPEALQLARAASRDQNNPDAIQKIMKTQLSREARKERADFTLSNEAGLETLKQGVIDLHHTICEHLKESDKPSVKPL